LLILLTIFLTGSLAALDDAPADAAKDGIDDPQASLSIKRDAAKDDTDGTDASLSFPLPAAAATAGRDVAVEVDDSF